MAGAESGIAWIDSAAAWRARPSAAVDEPAWRAGDTAHGWCAACQRARRFSVRGHPGAGIAPNLREALVCDGCGLSSRQRALFVALRTALAARTEPRVALLERLSRLHRRARRERWTLYASEYLDPAFRSGSLHLKRGRLLRHRSLTALDFADGELDAVVHGDVLEHVADYRTALRECRRVLRPGGVMLFTVPFAPAREATVVRGRLREDGSIEHLQPPEYHGDGMRRSGIYTFYNFSWPLLGDMREAGFARAEVGMVPAPTLRRSADAGEVAGGPPMLVLRGTVDAPGPARADAAGSSRPLRANDVEPR